MALFELETLGLIIEEKLVETQTVFAGKIFDIHKDKVDVAGEIKNREVMIHSGGVTIVAEHDGKILLVKQYL